MNFDIDRIDWAETAQPIVATVHVTVPGLLLRFSISTNGTEYVLSPDGFTADGDLLVDIAEAVAARLAAEVDEG